MPVKMQAGKGNLVFRRPFNGANRVRGLRHTPYGGASQSGANRPSEKEDGLKTPAAAYNRRIFRNTVPVKAGGLPKGNAMHCPRAPRPNLPLWWRLLQLVLFVPLAMAFTLGLSALSAEHYAAGSAADARFLIVTQNGGGGCRSEPLKNARAASCTLPPPAPSAAPACRDWPEREMRLCALGGGVYEMRDSGGGWTMTTRYRLENGRAVPLYFKMFTVAHAVAAFFITFVLYAAADFLLRRRLGRTARQA